MRSYSSFICSFFLPALLFGCASTNKSDTKSDTSAIDPGSAITVETSGDLYEDPLSKGYSIQFSGRCESNGSKVVIAANGVKSEVLCNNNSYTYRHLVPKKGQEAENTFWLTKLSFYHPEKESTKAQSWVLFDVAKENIKTILNQQFRFETLPSGQLKPILEITSLGYCSGKNPVTMKIGGVNEFQQPFDKFKADTTCKNGRFYFLTQTENQSWINLQLKISEKRPSENSVEENLDSPTDGPRRSPASVSVEDPKNEDVFNWSVELSSY